jgi:uncharacterized protein (TIGR02147 family)
MSKSAPGKNESNPWSYLTPGHALKDAHAALSANDQALSLKDWAERADVSTGFINNVLAGRRFARSDSLRAMAQALGCYQPDEIDHLLLVNDLATAKDPELRKRLMRDVLKVANAHGVLLQETIVQNYLSDAVTPVLRELALCDGFKDDAKDVQQRLRIEATRARVRSDLDFLYQHGFLAQKSNGKWYYPNAKVMECKPEIFGSLLLGAHLEYLKAAAKVLESADRSERFVQGLMISIDESLKNDAFAILKKALADVHKLAASSKQKNSVFYFAAVGVPFTKPENDETDG